MEPEQKQLERNMNIAIKSAPPITDKNTHKSKSFHIKNIILFHIQLNYD